MALSAEPLFFRVFLIWNYHIQGDPLGCDIFLLVVFKHFRTLSDRNFQDRLRGLISLKKSGKSPPALQEILNPRLDICSVRPVTTNRFVCMRHAGLAEPIWEFRRFISVPIGTPPHFGYKTARSFEATSGQVIFHFLSVDNLKIRKNAQGAKKMAVS